VEDRQGYYSFFDRVDMYPRLESRSLDAFIEEATKTVTEDTDRSILFIMNTVRSSQVLYEKIKTLVPEAERYYLSTMVRARAMMSLTDAFGSIGNVLSLSLGGYLLIVYNWGIMGSIIGSFGIVAGLILYMFVKEQSKT